MPDHFNAFEQHKKQVVQFSERLSELARAGGDEEAVGVLAEFMNRFSTNRFLVLVVGDFKSGKSSLVNALVGKAVCPVKATPRTAKVTRLSATLDQEPESLEIVYREDRPVERRRFVDGSLDELVAVGGKYIREVEFVDVFLHPGETILRHPVRLVDTPGIGSGEAEHSKLTREYLRHADAVLFVFAANKAYSETERDFLLTFRSLLDRTVFAVNRMDGVSDEDRKDIIEHIQASLVRDVLPKGAATPAIWPVSAASALKATKPSASFEDSGVPALVGALEERLAGTLALQLLSDIGGQQAQVCEGMAERAQFSLDALRASTSTLKAKKPAVAQLRGDLQSLMGRVAGIEEAVQQLEESALLRVPEQVSQVRSSIVNTTWTWIQRCPSEAVCREELPAVVGKIVSDRLSLLDDELLATLAEAQDSTEDSLRELFESMEERARQILVADKTMQKPARGGLRRRASALSRLAAIAEGVGGPTEGYGLASTAITGALAPSSTVRFLSVAAAVSLLLATLGGPVGWVVAGLASLIAAIAGYDHASTWRERVLNHISEALDSQVLGQTEETVEQSLRGYFVGLAADVRQRAAAFNEQLQSIAMEVDRELAREARNREKEEARLRAHIEHLDALRAELATFVGELPRPGPNPAAEPAAE